MDEVVSARGIVEEVGLIKALRLRAPMHDHSRKIQYHHPGPVQAVVGAPTLPVALRKITLPEEVVNN